MAGSESTETSIQTSEVSHLKSYYGARCRVLQDVGEYTHVVDIQLKETDMAIKFQLEENYPEVPPVVILKSKIIKQEQKEDLLQALENEVKEKIGSPMIESLMNFTKDWVCKHGLEIQTDSQDTVKSSPRGQRKKTGKKKHKKKEGSSEEEEELFPKKCSMKTAEDVLSRIFWDSKLDVEDFVIGYMDRFIGIVEKPISAFSWEDIASVDYNTLAIPKHRIHYFKYKSVKVWDKNDRMDNVFGSTGSKIDIISVIESYDDEAEKKAKMQEAANVFGNDDDSDDDISIDCGSGQDENRLPAPQAYWGAKLRPTHFIALKITDPEIISCVQEVQEIIKDIEPTYEDCMIPVERLHMTLCCLGLDTQEEVDKAIGVLHRIKPELADLHPEKIQLEFENTDHFFHSCLYAKLKHNQDLYDFDNHLRMLLRSAGLDIRDVFEFTPHITILKFPRQLQRDMHTRYLDPRIYGGDNGTYFGSQTINNIQLCEMSENRQDNGFYITPISIDF